VSKTKPIPYIIQAYESGQRHFGENYVQEIAEKANDPLIRQQCPDIQWHFIGHLQRNKISKLMSAQPNLFVVETVDSERLAESLNEASLKLKVLNVMVQVNISGEESKSGLPPAEVVEFVKNLKEKYIGLNFMGLMTIGEFDGTKEQSKRDFENMFKLREKLCDELQLSRSHVELSMGMSNDFEEAVQIGSTNVRVGSTIFGERPAKSTN